MLIVTVTSDWKDSSYYLPVLKGRLLSLCAAETVPQDLRVETISNNVEPFNIPQGCFILKNAFRSFPKGTIHLMAVNSEPQDDAPMVVVQYAGHWLVGPNDGRFSLLVEPAAIENGETVAYEIPKPYKFSTFMACDIFAKAVEVICNGTFASQLQVCTLKSVAGGMPAILEDRIIGKVVYTDSYGNAITNISMETFARGYKLWRSRNVNDPELKIYVGGPQLVLDMIYNSYSDVECGENVALFNWAGLLELAINCGNFCRVEGVEVNTEIMIKFY